MSALLQKPADFGGALRNPALALLIASAPCHAMDRVPSPGAEPPPAAAQRTDLAWMTAGFVAVQFAAVGLHHDDEAWVDEGHEYEDGFTQAPTWDDDSWVYNYVLHPWVGSEYYLAARNRAWTPWGSLAYSAALSTFYEFFVENLIQQPSANDLLITPLIGSLLGEARYTLKEKIRRHPSAVSAAPFWITLLDPLDISVGGYPDGHSRLYFNWKHAF